MVYIYIYIIYIYRTFVEYILIRRLQRSVHQQYDWAVCFKLGKISFCYGMSIGKIMETNMYPSFGGGLKVVGLSAMATVHRMNHESLSFGAGEMRPVDVQYISKSQKHEQKHHLQIIFPNEKSLDFHSIEDSFS